MLAVEENNVQRTMLKQDCERHSLFSSIFLIFLHVRARHIPRASPQSVERRNPQNGQKVAWSACVCHCSTPWRGIFFPCSIQFLVSSLCSVFFFFLTSLSCLGRGELPRRQILRPRFASQAGAMLRPHVTGVGPFLGAPAPCDALPAVRPAGRGRPAIQPLSRTPSATGLFGLPNGAGSPHAHPPILPFVAPERVLQQQCDDIRARWRRMSGEGDATAAGGLAADRSGAAAAPPPHPAALQRTPHPPRVPPLGGGSFGSISRSGSDPAALVAAPCDAPAGRGSSDSLHR